MLRHLVIPWLNQKCPIFLHMLLDSVGWYLYLPNSWEYLEEEARDCEVLPHHAMEEAAKIEIQISL